jgi:hypothetical protein
MRFLIFFLFIVLLPETRLCGDVYLLKDAGKVEGELVNPDEVPRKTYQIRIGDHLELGIESKYIDRSRKGERESILEYNAFAPFEEDTIENHLNIADWCSKHQLPELARQHWNQVLVHDPENKTVRGILRYIKSEDGSWITQKELLESRGLINENGVWKTQQQIDIERILDKRKRAEAEWAKKIDAWRRLLPNDAKAKSEMLSITDPLATTALWNVLQAERNEDTRILLLKALSHIKTSVALHSLAQWSINTREIPEVRKMCFDEIRKHPEAKQSLVSYYVSFLNPQNNDVATINAAAFAIGEIGGRSAMPQLIDTLETIHTETRVVNAPGPAFGNMGNANGTQFGWGTTKEKNVTKSQNQEVLRALEKLSGGVNFNFNQNAWRAWLIESRRTSSFNARRD